MPRVDHVILTRFNLPTGGVEGLVRAREGWLRERIELFERYCAPSVAGQRDADVHWIVYLDPASPDWLLNRMEPYAASGLLRPVLRESVDVAALREDIAAVVTDPGEVLLTTNLDNDDGLAADFCTRLSAVETDHARVALYVPDGLVLSGERLYLHRDRHNAFCSVRETWDEPLTSWSEYHNELHKVMPVLELPGPPGWVQVVHGGNVSNRVRGHLVSPSAHLAAFPFELRAVEPSRGQLVADRLVLAPARRVRDGARTVVRRAALRVLGKDGYSAAKARVRGVAGRLRSRSAT